MSAGIDYSGGIANRNPVTGIHFGVISQHTPAGEIWEDFQPVYPYGCPSCGQAFGNGIEPVVAKLDDLDEDELGSESCPTCGYEADDPDTDWNGDEAIGQHYTGEKTYKLDYSESLCCFFVLTSPYYTLARFCSPCAPGAGDLDNWDSGGVRTYCLGPDFFDKDRPCPYPIWQVADDVCVHHRMEDSE